MSQNTYVALSTQTLGTAASSVTFSSIPTTFTDIYLVGNYGLSSAGNTLAVQVGNGSADTGSNYSWTWLFGDGSSATSNRSSNTANIPCISLLGSENALSTQLNVNFQNYSDTTTYKTLLGRAGRATSGNYPGSGAVVGLWRSTNAINTIKLYDPNGSNIISGSTFTVYGLLASN